MDKPFLAIDLGASSGRAVLGSFAAGRLVLTEVHRFENHAVRLQNTVFWDFLHLWSNVLAALSRCAGSSHVELAGLGVDSWNLDFGLVDESGMLLRNPVSYRDQNASWVAARIADRISEAELYEATGMPVLPITGLARLLQLQRGPSSGLIDLARWYLPIPDLVRYYLTGDASIEETVSWGTQLVNIRTRGWNERLIERFGIPKRLLPRLVAPGTVAGVLNPSVAATTGLEPCPVIAVAEHDTLSAVFAASVLDPDAAILSVGTWSILGALVREPILSPEAHDYGFMNELAVGGVFLAKNSMGFFILEELIRCWSAEGIECDYQELAELGRSARPGTLSIDPNDPVFFAPPNMRDALREYCAGTDQDSEAEVGAVVRALYEGLASSYADALVQLHRLLRRPVQRLVMVGGAVRNEWFVRMVAGACGVEVVAGPPEATVVGNLCAQGLAVGRVQEKDLQAVLAGSFPVKTVRPGREG
jgi:rhamnulokinase